MYSFAVVNGPKALQEKGFKTFIMLFYKKIKEEGLIKMAALDFKEKIKQTTKRIEDSEKISQENKELLKDFRRDLKLEGLSNAWIHKLLAHLTIIGRYAEKKSFQDLNKEDLKDLVEKIQERDISEATLNDYKQVIKRFWKWLNNGEHPEKTSWINTGNRANNNKLPKDLLTKEDVENLIEAAYNSRDKALIAILWETGARIGELIDLKIGDIEERKHGKKVVIDGKTGERRLPLIESVPYLNQWLNKHPTGEKQDPLWCKIQQTGKGIEALSYNYIRQKILQKTRDKADLDKPVNPHHFRHSRATERASKWTEAMMCEFFGWVQGSDIPAKYVHLSGRDIDEIYDQEHGLVEEEEEEEKTFVEECPRCGELNENNTRFCGSCGKELSVEAAMEVEETEEEAKEKASMETLQETIEELQETIQKQQKEIQEIKQNQ